VKDLSSHGRDAKIHGAMTESPSAVVNAEGQVRSSLSVSATTSQRSGSGPVARDLSRLAALSVQNPSDSMAILKVATLQVWFNQDAEYTQTRQRALAWAAGQNQSDDIERAAKIACLRPNADAQTRQDALALARRAVAQGMNNPSMPWYQMTLGMAQFRAGNFAAADLSLKKAIEGAKTMYAEGGARVKSAAGFYRAMSLFHLNRQAEGRQLFQETAASMKPLPVDPDNPLVQGTDHDDIVLWLAYEEARDLLAGQSAMNGTAR
jgi:tetratricopeptide (TPR) repeat protein